MLWIAFIIWITLVFDNFPETSGISNSVVNCFHYLNYLGLWQPIQSFPYDLTRCELLSLFELPWSLTTFSYNHKRYSALWIAFIIWITLVFDNQAVRQPTTGMVVNCFHYLNYLGLWQLSEKAYAKELSCELLSLFELPWSLTTDAT